MGWLSRLFSVNSQGHRESRAFSTFDAIKPWLQEHLVDLDMAVFSIYEDERLMASSGALIIVGTATKITQETIGFLIEMDYGRILSSKQFYPEGVATWHKQDAVTAIELGEPLLDIMEHRERAHAQRQKTVGSDIKAQISAEFAKRKGRFETLDSKIQETILLEATMFNRIPRTVEMFYETASTAYDPRGFWKEQTRRLVEVWEQRGNLYRDSPNQADTQERQTSSEPLQKDVRAAALKVKEFAVWQYNNAQAARLSNPGFDEIEETERERKIFLAFICGAIIVINADFGLSDDDFISTILAFFRIFDGISNEQQLDDALTAMNSAAKELDPVMDAGIAAAQTFLNGGQQTKDELLLAQLLGYVAA